ncbi:MAG: hypothetical protein LBR05_07255 [Azoarcus sp.]|jgi:plasmid stability protein|nr:hypothetical protein [Azoarcus sp.]
MPVTLTIKQVPDELAARLRAIAASNHRSLQGELLHTIEARVAAIDTRYSDAPLVTRLELNDSGATAARQSSAASMPTETVSGTDFLARLDAIVAGSHFGEAPLLTREQANDRAFLRAMMQSDDGK